MNKYGMMAMDHWQLHAPRQYEELTNPQEFFTQLGEELADEIIQIAEVQERRLPPDLGYIERVQQLTMIQRQAEEIVLSERLWSIHEPSQDLETQLEEILNPLPSSQMIETKLEYFDDRVARTCELSRIEFGYTDEEEAYRERVIQVRDLLSRAEDPALSWEERLHAAEQANNLYLILDV
ncbi:MAG: hypothetical protein Q4D96_09235 [Propionibacteriaceae bacterium]|nr:hypothetical protein [Propionibacteriaceae bacterium]